MIWPLELLKEVGLDIVVHKYLTRNLEGMVDQPIPPVSEEDRARMIAYIRTGMEKKHGDKLWARYLKTLMPPRGEGKPGEEDRWSNLVGRIFVTFAKDKNALKKIFERLATADDTEFEAMLYMVENDRPKQRREQAKSVAREVGGMVRDTLTRADNEIKDEVSDWATRQREILARRREEREARRGRP